MVSKTSRLRLLVVAAILIAATNVFSQTSNNDLAPAIKLVNERRSNEAIAALKQALKTNKQNAAAWYYLGVVHLQLNDFKKASDAFQEAIKLKLESPANAHSGYAYALFRRGKFKDGTQEAQKALALDPKNLEALYTLGVINLRTGNHLEAVKLADTLISLKPDLAEAHLVKSQALVRFTGDAVLANPGEPKEDRLERYKSAAAALEKYLELSPASKDVQLWQNQLESLKFHMGARSGTNDLYRPREVTTKVALIAKPEPQYTQTARNEQVEGRVVLRCVFASDGSIKHILVVEALPFGLTEVSIAAAKQIRFTPATLNGKPVSMLMQVEYNFSLY